MLPVISIFRDQEVELSNDSDDEIVFTLMSANFTAVSFRELSVHLTLTECGFDLN